MDGVASNPTTLRLALISDIVGSRDVADHNVLLGTLLALLVALVIALGFRAVLR